MRPAPDTPVAYELPALDGLIVGSEHAAYVLSRLVTFLERTSDLVGVTDDKGTILYMNRSARSLLGVREDSDEPVTTAEVFPPEAFDIYFDQIRPRIIGGDVWTGYLPIRGVVEPLEMWATVVGETRPGGEVSWMVLAARDLNDWHHAPEPHQRHAAYDELTGLAARSLLMDHLAKARDRAARTGQEVAVAFIDLDDTKVINHTFGTRVGDAVLVEVAHRLSDAVRVIDTVARVGGDQFVVLFDGVADEDEAVALATQIQANLESTTVEVADRAIDVSASIGIALAREGEAGDQLIGRADTAMYEVKADRRHQSGRPAPTIGADLRSVTLKDLAVAVTRHEIVPYYQRVVDEHGTVHGTQALARWLRPSGPAVDAGQFLGIADDSGVSFSLDLAILRQAAAELAPHPELGRLYVPVSPRFLRRAGVDRFVDEVLARADLAPERLAVLVPETLVTARSFVIGDAVGALQDLGVRLVIDTRPSPNGLRDDDDAEVVDLRGLGERLAAVRTVFGQVRLAPAWIPLLDLDPDQVAAAVGAALDRGQEVIAGGVETEEQRRRLLELGVTLVSGHLVAHPAPAPA